MSSLYKDNPIGRFDDRAQAYAQHRPDYPDAALDSIITTCRLGPQSLLVEVGSGTGIASRQFAGRGIPVLGLEPNDQMRAQAEAATPTGGTCPPRYQSGTAEATGLPDASADAVLAAQAFHWFEPETALREFCRILRPDGWVVLMWNERDESDPFTRAYGDVLRTVRDTGRVESDRAHGGASLLQSPLFCHGRRLDFPHRQQLDEEGLLGRAFSASYIPAGGSEGEAVAGRLRDVFARFEREGQVALRYTTSVYLGQKSNP